MVRVVQNPKHEMSNVQNNVNTHTHTHTNFFSETTVLDFNFFQIVFGTVFNHHLDRHRMSFTYLFLVSPWCQPCCYTTGLLQS
jgi:hypothetical protein